MHIKRQISLASLTSPGLSPKSKFHKQKASKNDEFVDEFGLSFAILVG